MVGEGEGDGGGVREGEAGDCLGGDDAGAGAAVLLQPETDNAKITTAGKRTIFLNSLITMLCSFTDIIHRRRVVFNLFQARLSDAACLVLLVRPDMQRDEESVFIDLQSEFMRLRISCLSDGIDKYCSECKRTPDFVTSNHQI